MRSSTLLGRCLVEARPTVQVIVLMRFLAGVALGRTDGHELPRVLLGAVAWSMVSLVVYLYNGVADRTEDVANGSDRPIASGRLPADFTRRVIAVLVAAALLGSVWAGRPFFLLTVIALVNGYLYSGPPMPLKKRYYAASISGMFGGFLTYLAGAEAGGRAIGAPLLVFAVAMSAWMGAVGAIAKDLSDVAGDRLAGRRTLPAALGPRRAGGLMLLAAAAVASGFTVAAVLTDATLLWPAAAVCAGTLVLLVVTVRLSAGADRAERRRPYRVFMRVQYFGHVLLGGALAFTLLRSH